MRIPKKSGKSFVYIFIFFLILAVQGFFGPYREYNRDPLGVRYSVGSGDGLEPSLLLRHRGCIKIAADIYNIYRSLPYRGQQGPPTALVPPVDRLCTGGIPLTVLKKYKKNSYI